MALERKTDFEKCGQFTHCPFCLNKSINKSHNSSNVSFTQTLKFQHVSNQGQRQHHHGYPMGSLTIITDLFALCKATDCFQEKNEKELEMM